MTIKKYIFEKKWEFKFTFLKKKQSSNKYDSSIVHPNTRFTWTVLSTPTKFAIISLVSLLSAKLVDGLPDNFLSCALYDKVLYLVL
ncbi:MAG: hypothetical protein ACRD8K_03270 [Nitrososphaeraceae archaeon]